MQTHAVKGYDSVGGILGAFGVKKKQANGETCKSACRKAGNYKKQSKVYGMCPENEYQRMCGFAARKAQAQTAAKTENINRHQGAYNLGGVGDRSESLVDVEGTNFKVINQGKLSSCVAASCTMVRWYKGCPRAQEPNDRRFLQRVETGNDVSLSDRKRGLEEDWDAVGTFLENVPAALAKGGGPLCAGEYTYEEPSKRKMLCYMQQATPADPIIIQVNWHGGGAHALVCIGPSADGSKINILDPIYRFKQVQNNLANFQKYMNNVGTIQLMAVVSPALKARCQPRRPPRLNVVDV